MSVRKLTTKLTMLLVLITGSIHATAAEPALPLADPFAFDPDYQWFEPIYEADMMDMKPKKRAHTGWFATYDKLNIYGKRPDTADSGLTFGGVTVDNFEDDYKLDDGGGNRYEFGYMNPDTDTGMLFNYTGLSVSASDGSRVDRINRLNQDNLEGNVEFPLGGSRFGLPVFPEDGNVIGFSRRFYDIGQTLNNFEMNSYELMKTWRMEPYHYGGILEPMLGFRYIQGNDLGALRTYGRTRDTALPLATGFAPYYIDLLENDDALEVYTEDISAIENEMYTMQAGFRYFKFQNRFRYSAEFRTFAGLNLQCLNQYQRQTSTLYDGFDVGSEVVQNVTTTTPFEFTRNEEFFIGYDVRAELGYQLTKMVHVRGGVQLIDLALGLWRNDRSFGSQNQDERIDNGGNREQSFLAVGYTFGIELNR